MANSSKTRNAAPKQVNSTSAESLQKNRQNPVVVDKEAQELEQSFAKDIEKAYNAHQKEIAHTYKQIPELQPASLNKPAFKKLSSEMISRFGFKNADDIRVFLLSPAGKSVKQRVANQINLQQNIDEAERIRRQDEAIRKSRFLAFLAMLFASKKKAHAPSLDESFQKLIDKTLHRKPSKITSPKADSSAANRALKAYQMAENALNTRLKTQDDLIAKLDEKLQSLEQQGIQEEAKYKELTKTVEESNQDITDILGQYVNNLDPLFVAAEEMDDPVQKDKQDILKKFDKNIALIQKEHDNIVKQLHDDSELIERAPQLLIKIQSFSVKLVALQDIKSLLAGEKIFCNHEGQETKSIAQSRFIVPKTLQISVVDGKKHLFSKEHKIAKDDNGKHYLLEPGQTLSEMDAEEKTKAEQKLNKAHEQFNRKEPELRSISELVSNNQELVRGFIADQVSKNTKEKEAALQVKNDIHTELHQLRARKQAILAYEQSRPAEELQQEKELSHNQQVLNQAGMNHREHTPKPSPSMNASKKAVNPEAVRQRFVTILNTIRNNPSAMHGLKDALREAAKHNPELSLALRDFRGNPEMLQGDSFRLIVELTKNMKAEHMQPLITKLEETASKHSKEIASQPENEATQTPFNMTPLSTKLGK